MDKIGEFPNFRIVPVKTLSSANLQANFGKIADIVKGGETIVVTQHGRPTLMVVSYTEGQEMLRLRDKMLVREYMNAKSKNEPTDSLPLPKTISLETAKFVSENYPLSRKEAGEAMHKHLASMSNRAAEEGLTEEDVIRMLNEDD